MESNPCVCISISTVSIGRLTTKTKRGLSKKPLQSFRFFSVLSTGWTIWYGLLYWTLKMPNIPWQIGAWKLPGGHNGPWSTWLSRLTWLRGRTRSQPQDFAL